MENTINFLSKIKSMTICINTESSRYIYLSKDREKRCFFKPWKKKVTWKAGFYLYTYYDSEYLGKSWDDFDNNVLIEDYNIMKKLSDNCDCSYNKDKYSPILKPHIYFYDINDKFVKTEWFDTVDQLNSVVNKIKKDFVILEDYILKNKSQ